ncbi:MAG: hypothetical protein Q8N14_06600 [Candidatus Omnitrophota bacterium]|nr:hypothetical protein [Candidatus Omnitrophota bacterium]
MKKNISVIVSKEVSIELIHFGRYMTTDEVLSELDKMGLRPTTLKKFRAFSEKHPDIRRKFPIIALGSIWRRLLGYQFCAYLDGSESRLIRDLAWFNYRWSDVCRFAAVRK